jgi:hypothetical protein
MPSLCTICQKSQVADHEGVVGACPACATTLIRKGKAWIAMVKRFLTGKPEPGETFSIVREVVESSTHPGSYVALESIGSNLVSARLARAERFDSEPEARKALDL